MLYRQHTLTSQPSFSFRKLLIEPSFYGVKFATLSAEIQKYNGGL